jgi:hypothetical protein
VYCDTYMRMFWEHHGAEMKQLAGMREWLDSFWCEMGEQMPVVVCSPICLGLWSASSITEPPMFEL